MKFHKQQILHDPDNGKWGDCFRTVIACLLDLEPQDVPHFADGGNETMSEDADTWLAQRGYKRLVFGLWGDLETTFMAMEYWNKGIPYMLIGQSPRGTPHVVIARDREIIHDPHPEGGGLIGPSPSSDRYLVEFIVRLVEDAPCAK